ncbi:hypothetical protein GOBAR_DD11233 [Gossypium barbadense]|nr:hypothetical protein GOBAR_DD11233 [Gossypium barbadense]
MAHYMWFGSKVGYLNQQIPRSSPIIGSYGPSSIQGDTFPYGHAEMKISRRHRYGYIPKAIHYPMRRDTAKYPPLMKTSKLSNSLKYLTQAYLGYDIQNGIQDPYEDCVATMRLYVRMRRQIHRRQDYPLASDPQNRNNFASWRQNELERMSPEEMLAISRSDYYCWCLDSA